MPIRPVYEMRAGYLDSAGKPGSPVVPVPSDGSQFMNLNKLGGGWDQVGHPGGETFDSDPFASDANALNMNNVVNKGGGGGVARP